MNICAQGLCALRFHFLWAHTSKWYHGVMRELSVSIFEKLPNCFPLRLPHFTFPAAVYEGNVQSHVLTNTSYCLAF